MSELKIFGHSDDCIEIEGDIREEWGAYDSGNCFIPVSDGTMLSIRFDDEGIWRIVPSIIGEGTKYENKQAVAADYDNSDIVTLTNDKPFVWIAFGFNSDDEPNPILPAINYTQLGKLVS